METWALVLLILAGILVGGIVLVRLLRVWASGAYKRIKRNPQTSCDIDAFVGPDHPVDSLKIVVAHRLQIGPSRVASLEAIPLECYSSGHVEGLYVTRKAGVSRDGASGSMTVPASSVVPVEQVLSGEKKAVVVVTIRMGFGHHRLAYSAASWAMQTGHPTIFHDLLNIESPESDLIRTTDELYSKGSRIATEFGGPIERLWGKAMLSGDANALRIAANVAAHLQPLLLAFPRDTPMITTHQLCALVAAAVGFTNVVNLVIDNHPQWFLTVPKTLNAMQGPVNYESFLRMGVRPEECRWAGHWCPHGLVANIAVDCARRIERCRQRQQRASPCPALRLLIPVGGAGAQRKFIIALVQALAGLVRANKVQLLLNAGDHAHMKVAFEQVLAECAIDFETVSDTKGVQDFQQSLLQGSDPAKPVTLFAFTEYFPAVATTDILSRVADVLCCKPSELAFYCVPKLHIRRVGDHEADSARRSSELGDGTCEAREVADALQYVRMFLDSSDLLISMNEAIVKNHSIGIYSGCQRAVQFALQPYQQ